MHRVDGQYINPKAACIAKDVERIIAERSQPLPDSLEPPSVNKNAIYVEVSARHDKGRVFGLGSMYSGSFAGSSFTSSPEVVFAPDPDIHAIRTETDTPRQEIADLRARNADSDKLAQDDERLA
ncbi:hypothetical protein C2S51_032631 [Perilla frutescens var. frutescens]|nr:hypothetical protein C2S51_032631 [Perilla frutescens var. frutescens]